MNNRKSPIDNKTEVIFHFKGWGTCNDVRDIWYKQVNRVVATSLNEFQHYMTLDAKERIEWILEHWEEFNY